MTDDAMNKLRAIADPTPPLLPGFTGLEAFSGSRPPVRFIVTRDHDGQVELSLSLPGPKRPTEAHARAFFRWLGVEPVEERRRQGSQAFRAAARDGALE